MPRFTKNSSSKSINNLEGRSSDSEESRNNDIEFNAEIDKALSSANEILNNVKSNENNSAVITSGNRGVNESTNAQVNHKLEILDGNIVTRIFIIFLLSECMIKIIKF